MSEIKKDQYMVQDHILEQVIVDLKKKRRHAKKHNMLKRIKQINKDIRAIKKVIAGE